MKKNIAYTPDKNVFYETMEIPIEDSFDVIVAGGGVAGVSAALAARRCGYSVLLIEKSVMLGGLATLGHIAIYLPLCDGEGRKVTGGIAEELLHLSIKYSYDNLPEYWKNGGEGDYMGGRYRTHFNVPAFVVALDELVIEEGIKIMFDTITSRPIMEDNECKGVIVENKSGRYAYLAKVVIDATGDADVMARAGAECVLGQNWLSYWAYLIDFERMNKALESNNIFDAVDLRAMGAPSTGVGYEDIGSFDGTDARDVTSLILMGREILREEIKKYNRTDGCAVSIPGMAQFRTTRQVLGIRALKPEDKYTHIDDSIGVIADWRTNKKADLYEVPYRSLIDSKIPNIIAAGRITAAKGDAWEITRVIPTAALTGQAAGTAAALSISSGRSLQELDVLELQQQLSDAGVLIHF